MVDTFAVLAELGGDPGGTTSPFVEVVRSISGLSVNSCCEGDGGGSGFVEGAVAEHGDQDVDAPASEAEEGSGVCVLNAKRVCL